MSGPRFIEAKNDSDGDGRRVNRTSITGWLLASLIVEFGVQGIMRSEAIFTKSVSPAQASIVFAGITIATFLVNPILLMIVSYLMTKSDDFQQYYGIIGASLFTGGLVGGLIGYWLMPFVIGIGGLEGPGFPGNVAANLGFLWLVFDSEISFGLSTLFPGFMAASLRFLKEKRTPGV
jgi:hypothetical protein